MTLVLRYAVRSDVGLLREGNEDSAYAGPHLLAIADGMGGHAAGEVASAVAIEAIERLDRGDVPDDQLLDALADAVAKANSTLHAMSVEDPSVEGMGTTLTALLWAGGTVAICHIGDSRAYLLRDGDFRQITRDHTLVQSLVDDGRLSPAQAATHPQRSLVMRALQSGTEAEPDLSILEARGGDRYLLCSDGLSDVVSEETLRKALIRYGDRDQAVAQLIELAIRGGGPDNITCIVADVVEEEAEPAGQMSIVVGAASNGDGRPRLRTDSPAERAHQLLTQTGPAVRRGAKHSARTDNTFIGQLPQPAEDEEEEEDDGPAEARARRRRWPIVTTILVILVIVIVGGGYAAWRYTQSQYYVGTDGHQVIIYRGINQKVAGISLNSVYQKTGIPLSEVPANDRSAVLSTTPASTLASAQKTVTSIRQTITCDNYLTAYQSWLAHKPAAPSRTASSKVIAAYQKATRTWQTHRPSTPKGCTAQGTAG
jgi:serine/threonine protein phosphatase PrpC